MPFERIEHKKRSVYAVEQIIKVIQDGLYKVGDKLPPERVIAEKTGVSRSSVREAFSALKIVGIVESRAGDGTYVKGSPENANGESHILSVLKENESPSDVLETRRVFEDSIIEFAVDRATDVDIAGIESVLKRMGELADIEDYRRYLEAHRDFHLAIARATRNPVIERVIRLLLDLMRQQLWQEVEEDYYLPKDEQHIKESLEKHHQIYAAIKDKDAKLAREKMREHLDMLLNGD
ncbi:FadR family transcriptional regulator [Dehalococcoidia bacterium]|nr:FadR family transcriptional regulator [Dehalococcoidia bacterium]MCL0029810.1 FadR family transcriptional regulator [Dehalococcoidia bacterium]MCL0058331.1 FadR family transcriptional regulator [Dehalococcoidia bacterium]MCL0069707.1 FadR family transcriptional regulator [Dehalococcoidia bacterium]MCL0076979.1 FadR family transcriptional regulator [Dehalococcoidia bacterium]